MTYELIDVSTLNTVGSFEGLITAIAAWAEMDPSDADELVLVAFDSDGLCTGARNYGQEG